MPLSRSRDYLSIGEVLDSLRAEFPDITISKIRFLETEGLINPERTGSGYRKFFDQDVARLRYILGLQRDHFLPLKIIRERLDQADSNGGVPAVPPPSLVAQAAATPVVQGGTQATPTQTSAPGPEPIATDVQLTREELCRAAGLGADQLAALEEYGVLSAGDGGLYEGSHLVLAKAARGFLERGLEPRHLKMFRQFAEREANLFEQMVGPVALRKDPEARRKASGSISQLVALARQLHDASLSTSVKDLR
jgi:DNA-binding transcriptional MerR regulator